MGFLKNEDQSIDLTELLICIIMKDWLLLPSRDIHVLRSFIPNGIFIIRSNLHSTELYNICIPANSSLVCNLRYGILRMTICRLLIIKYEYSVIYVPNNDICITSVWHLYDIYMTSKWPRSPSIVSNTQATRLPRRNGWRLWPLWNTRMNRCTTLSSPMTSTACFTSRNYCSQRPISSQLKIVALRCW